MKHWMAEAQRRLQSDFQLSIITLLGLMGAVGITPFAVYRFLVGDTLVGIVDSLAVSGILLAVVFAWKTGRLALVGAFLAVVNCTAAVAVSLLFGVFGLFWVYSTLLANFFLIPVRYAWGVAVVVLGLLFFMDRSFASPAERWSFVVTCLVVCCFAATFAIRSELQRRQLRDLATRDALTGVANRRSLDDEMLIAVAEFRRCGRRPGLLVLDLDYFKAVNDNHGHDVGDRVLKDFASLVQRFTRSQDRLFRFGGEEFVLLINEADDAGMARVGENIRLVIEQRLRCPDGAVTVSIGAALLKPDEGPREWLRRADQALLRAKHAGRNRLCVADVGQQMPPSDQATA